MKRLLIKTVYWVGFWIGYFRTQRLLRKPRIY